MHLYDLYPILFIAGLLVGFSPVILNKESLMNTKTALIAIALMVAGSICAIAGLHIALH